MKAILQYRASPGLRQQLAALDFPTVIVDEVDKETFLREIREAVVLLHMLEPVTAAVIDAAPRLKLIQKIGIGVNTIDLDAARRRGIAVCNMPGTNTQAVPEMTLLLILATLRRLAQLDALTRAGRGWALEPEMSDNLGELPGRTVGLVGFGAVARRLMPMLQAIGAKVVYTSREAVAGSPTPFLPLPELLPAADVLSLHLPLTPETTGIMDAGAFAAMKRGSILINTARGPLVDEAALRGALASGHLRGAGLDVFALEPVGAENPLLKLPNVVVTPHLAWLTAETLERSLAVIAENRKRVRDGEALLHRGGLKPEGKMTNAAARAVEACLVDLFQHLGIERAHIAAGQMVRNDWYGLATRHSQRIASLTLVSPPMLDTSELHRLASRLLVVAGDQGRTAQGAIKLLQDLPSAASYILRGYECQPWSDVNADRGTEIGPAMLDFLDRVHRDHPVVVTTLSEGEGEAAGISYRIRGTGLPLVLMPLDLAPSQWEPLIPQLSERYCTIILGGPALGVVSLLEGRGRSVYLSVVRTLLDAVRIKPGEVILEVGCGSGVVLREIARRTSGANPVIGMDLNPYLLGEAMSLAAREGLADRITFQEGHAEAIPLAANSVDVALSCTVMEEGDADRMLGELVRVTKPGGRIAAIVRALDMPWWANLPLSAALRSKADRPGLIGAGAAAAGCADTSLYRRFHAAGLTELIFFPQLVAVTPTFEPFRLAGMEQQILATLTVDETTEWREAVARAEADETFFIASPHHCAVGTKPG